ncbi:hypothetical protein H2203_007192 [Taxawa tesnikishii (nom. ined.)]|nr:hypothetical protein H2203_007192 [Dothideales sp. JES 119]
MPLTKVTLVGANGKLGPHILSHLLSAGNFSVTVLSRQSSSSTYPSSVSHKHVSDEFPEEELAQALKGQDAVIVATGGSLADLQIRIADAAAKAGVTRFIPADFGSCDSSSERALRLVPLYVAKKRVRDHLIERAAEGGLSWTSLVCGHFFDYGLGGELLAFDVRGREARIFDGGDVRWSTTTLDTIALATVRILQKEAETKNRMLYIQSFCITQNELLRECERVTGEVARGTGQVGGVYRGREAGVGKGPCAGDGGYGLRRGDH